MGDDIKVIGVAGQLQNGKDVLADYLIEVLNNKNIGAQSWVRTAFAYNVKKVYCDTFGVGMDFIEKWKTIPEPPPGFDMTVRQSLQFIGDGFRKIYPTIWIDLVFRRMSRPSIISDTRYINELKRIKQENGINILIWRPGKENDDPNGSEAQIRPLVDYFAKTGMDGATRRIQSLENKPNGADLIDIFIVNDKGIPELYKKVDEVAVPYIEKHFFLL